MSKSNPRDQIDKASFTLVEGIKDAVAANIASASQQSQLNIDKETLPRLLAVINASIEEGYHRGNRVFMRTVESALGDAALPPLSAAPAKKKSA